MMHSCSLRANRVVKEIIYDFDEEVAALEGWIDILSMKKKPL